MKRIRSYGSKRYAVHLLRELLRDYAKVMRTRTARQSSGLISFERHGMFLGAWSALCAVGALNDAQSARWMARKKRVDAAKVTRRPFGEVRRA